MIVESLKVSQAVFTVYFLCLNLTPTLATIPSLSSALSGVESLFEYQTNELLQDNDEGIVAAFGDFNGDERVDIFVITNNSQRLDVLHAKENKPYMRSTILTISNAVMTSIVPADFNGDAQMDILLVSRPIGHAQGPYNVSIYWGNHTTSPHSLSDYLPLPDLFYDEPLVFDFNADMYPDLLSETAPGVRKVWLSGGPDKSFSVQDFPGSHNATPFYSPQSHAIIDMNADLTADLVLTTQTHYELWISVEGVFTLNTTYPLPPLFKDGYIGQSSFADLDQDRMMEHIVPGCKDADCKQSAVMIRHNGEWLELMTPENFSLANNQWSFIPPEKSSYRDYINQTFPVMLRITDYNLDGYPDAIVVLSNASATGDVQRVFVLDNVPCRGDLCDSFTRTFEPHTTNDKNTNNAMVATFYDIYEDGMPDIVMVTMSVDDKAGTHTPRMVLLKNDAATESCFMKVTVVSGLCYKHCPEENNPYGVNYPGPSITYSTMKTDGTQQQSSGTQLSQTAHYALQTPYQIFGLGDTPNIIDEMEVGIPNPENQPQREKTWSFIIPNSQLIVIPNPPQKPPSWMLKLYITPSQLVYLTAAALLGTCGFVIGIIGILHWREKREDTLEKKQESQRFHFDAM